MGSCRTSIKWLLVACLIPCSAAVKNLGFAAWEAYMPFDEEVPTTTKMNMKRHQMHMGSKMDTSDKVMHKSTESSKSIVKSIAKGSSMSSTKGSGGVGGKGSDHDLITEKKSKLKSSSKISSSSSSVKGLKSLKSSKKKMVSTKESMKKGLEKPQKSSKQSPKMSTKGKGKGGGKGKGKGKGKGYESIAPSIFPSPDLSSLTPSMQPTEVLDLATSFPSPISTMISTMAPTTTAPTTAPSTTGPTTSPTTGPTTSPTIGPTPPPTTVPTTMSPTSPEPTPNPTPSPTPTPTMAPTTNPSFNPTSAPSSLPTEEIPPLFCFDVDDLSCGPDVWEDAPIDGNQCGGNRNSPIELSSLEVCDPLEYTFDGGTCTFDDLEYEVNQFRMRAIYPASLCTAPTVKIGDLTYAVDSWEYSLGTGHSIDGEPTLGAMEILHSIVNGDSFAEPVSIIGIGTVLGEADPFVDRVLNGFTEGYFEIAASCDVTRDPIYEGVMAPLQIANPYTMLSESPEFYQYLGSQTVPPCEQNVFWNYLAEYISISEEQNDSMRSMILGRIDPENCRFDTVADPDTGSTTRPAIDPRNRPISLAGECQRRA